MGRKKVFVEIPKELVQAFVTAWNKLNHNRYNEGLQAHEINRGWCYQFALVMKKVYKNRCTIYTNRCHAWVKMNGLFYDSDHREGTDDRWEIDNSHDEPRHVTMGECEEYWNKNGSSGEVRWDVIEHAIELYKR